MAATIAASAAMSKSLTGAPANGWNMWLYEEESGKKISIDRLREKVRKHVDK